MILAKFRLLSLLTPIALISSSSAWPRESPPAPCPMPAVGGLNESPKELRSRNGRLQVNLSLRNSLDSRGQMQYCYIDDHGDRSPTLRVRPGDLLILKLKNELSLPSTAQHPHQMAGSNCASTATAADATNLHFHGLSVPPSCHADDSLHTSIPPSSKAFVYRFRIPGNQPPGLYWYHPHPHGHSEEEVLGGASGAPSSRELPTRIRSLPGFPRESWSSAIRSLRLQQAPVLETIPAAQQKTCLSISSPSHILNIQSRLLKPDRSSANSGACLMPPQTPTSISRCYLMESGKNRDWLPCTGTGNP